MQDKEDSLYHAQVLKQLKKDEDREIWEKQQHAKKMAHEKVQRDQ